MPKATLFYSPFHQFFTNAGAVLSGGSLTFYRAGTTTLTDTYTDSTKNTANPNPITLDTAGRPDNSGSPIQIWLDGSYKVVLKDSSGATIRTEDNVTSLSQFYSVSSKSIDYTVLTSDQNTLILVDASGGAKTITLPAAATAGTGFQIGVKKVDTSSNTVTIAPDGSELINGLASKVLRVQYDGAWLACTGTAWQQWAETKTNIRDVNDNELLIFTQTASPVNYVNIASAATNNPPSLASAGDDTNVGLTIDTQGTGTLTLGSADSVLDMNGTALTVDVAATTINGTVAVTVDNATTDAVTTVATLTHTTSGTAANGIGTGLAFSTESADETPAVAGRLSFELTDVTSGSEDSTFTIQNRVAGAASLTDAYKFANTGGFAYTITGAPTAARTITIKDESQTLGIATAAEQEAGSVTTAYVTPGRQQLHRSAAKFWVKITGTSSPANFPTPESAYNVASITDNGTGDYTVTYTTAFEDASYAVFATASGLAAAYPPVAHIQQDNPYTSSACRIIVDGSDSGFSALDPLICCVVGFGNQ